MFLHWHSLRCIVKLNLKFWFVMPLLLWFVGVVLWWFFVGGKWCNSHPACFEFHSFWSPVFVHSTISRKIRQRDDLASGIQNIILNRICMQTKVRYCWKLWLVLPDLCWTILKVNTVISYPLASFSSAWAFRAAQPEPRSKRHLQAESRMLIWHKSLEFNHRQ